MSNQYSKTSQVLHWLIAGLILGQFFLAKMAERAEISDSVLKQLALLANHKSIGITILFLAFVRLLWRLMRPPPALPVSVPAWQASAAAATHWAIYVLLFFIPMTGWLMSSATAYSVSWFNLFVLPDFLAPDQALSEFFSRAHEVSTKLLLLIVVLHVAAAVKHHYFDKDEVLLRMANKSNWLILIATTFLVALLLGQPVSKAKPLSVENQGALSNAQGAESRQLETSSNLGSWDIDYEDSYIEFIGDQAGAPFEGRWQRWQAEIKFDKARLNDSSFEVAIEIASVSTGDEERDEYILDPDFFDQVNFAEAKFTASGMTINQKGRYETEGQLTMKGLTQGVEFVFHIEEVDGQEILIGESKIDRLAWNIGTGDWADTTWVGQEVVVNVRVAKTK